MQAAHLLWTDTRLYRRRHEKSAAALVATARALRRNRPLAGGEDEFLALYRAMADADPRLFTHVWQDPTAYYWVRMAYQLTATCLTGAPLPPLAQDYCADVGAGRPEEALAATLGDFKRFVLALRLAAGTRVRFRTPLAARLPVAIPASPLSLDGEGEVRIHALAGGRLDLEHDGRRLALELTSGATADGVAVTACPTLRGKGLHVALQPHALNLPGLGFARPAMASPADYQAAHASLVGESLGIMARHHPTAHRHFGRLMRLLVMKPYRTGDYTNVSHSDLPGAAICSVIEDPYELTDTLVHELHHNRFFFVEESGPFFRDSTAAVVENRYYSPWRDDLRPLHGVFHALYVYLPVARYWLAVYRSGETTEPRRSWVVDRVLRIPRQLRLAAGVLRRHADFTPLGASLFDAMAEEVAAIGAETKTLGLPAAAPAMKLDPGGRLDPERDATGGRPLTVAEAVTSHVTRHDLHGQCDGDETS